MHVPGRFLSQRIWPIWAMGREGIVAEVLSVEVLLVMGIEAAEHPLDLGAGADRGAVYVDREPGQAARRERFDDQVMVELYERRHGCRSEVCLS